MPTLWAHRYFWRARTNIPIPPTPTLGGYPLWQASVIAGSLVGGLQLIWERLTYAWFWMRQAWHWTPDEAHAMSAALTAVHQPEWPIARDAVYLTARAEKFNESQEWAKLGHELKTHHGWAENTWRHLHALYAVEQAGGALSNPDRNLLVELAYHEYARSGRGKPPRMV